MPRHPLPRPYTILTIVVCIISAAIGAFIGLIYEILGASIAGIGGAAAGLIWSRLMLKFTRKGDIGANLVGKAVFWGIVVGVADTWLLHIAGPILTDAGITGIGIVLFFASICGVVVGALNGLICGAFWNAIAKKHPLSAASQE